MAIQDIGLLKVAIYTELKRRGITPYALSKLQTALNPQTIRQFLYSTNKEVMSKTVEVMLEELDLVIVPAAEIRMLRRLAKRLALLKKKPPIVNAILKALVREKLDISA